MIGSETNRASPATPKDPYKLVYIIFCVLGMGSLLPWNFFISVSGYWMHKFRNVSVNVDTPPNAKVTSDDNPDPSNTTIPLTPLQLQWNSYLSIASMIPNVTFLLLNATFGHHFPTLPRLLVALVVIIVTFVFTTVTSIVNTDAWQNEFLISTLVSVVIINIMVAIFQGGVAGVAAKFPPQYMGSMLQGQALGGIFSAATLVLLLACGVSNESSGFYCFLITMIFLAVSLVAFIVLTRSEFFKYYMNELHIQAPSNQEAPLEDDNLIPPTDHEIKIPEKINVLRIAGQIWVWIAAVFLTFLVTLSVFPTITSLAKSVNGTGSEWNTKFFIPVGCFLLFNVGDFVGRFVAAQIGWPNHKMKFGGLVAFLMAFLRLAFIPLFIFCNVSPANRENTDVAFKSDTAYLIFMALFSLSNGYIGTVCMMFAPKLLPEGEQQATAASIMVSFLVLGLAVGAFLSPLSLLML